MSTDTEQVPAPDLPFSEDKTDNGLFRNCDLFLIAKKTILPGDFFTWYYPMVDAKTPEKLPPSTYPYPPTKKRNRSVSPVVLSRTSPLKPTTWAPQFKGHQPLLLAAKAQASKAKSDRVSKLSKHQCSHFTKCQVGKCCDCNCTQCATNHVLAGSRRPPCPKLPSRY